MFNGFKKKAVIGLVAAIAVFCCAAYLLLSRSTFYAEMVAQKVGDAFYDAGAYSLEIESLEGNPLTGVVGHGVSISHAGVPIARSKIIEMKPLISSVISGNPKLSFLAFEGLAVDYDVVSAHLPVKSDDSSQPPALERLALYDSTISTPWGRAELSKFSLVIGDNEYEVDCDGTFRGKDASLEASVSVLGKSADIAAFNGEWDGMRLSAKGALTPVLSVDCVAEGLDVSKIAEMVPSMRDAGLSGVFDTWLQVSQRDGIRLCGALASDNGVAAGIPYRGLSANYAYADGSIGLRDVRATLYDSILSGGASIDISAKTPILSLTFKILDLKPEKLTANFPWLEGIRGDIDSISCDIKGTSDSLSGPIHVAASNINALDLDFADISAKIELKQTEKLRLSLFCKSMGADVAASGDIKILPEVALDVGVSASPLAVEALAEKYPEIKRALASGDISLTAAVSGRVDDIFVSGIARSSHLVASEDVNLQGVSSEFEYSKGALKVKNMRGNLEDATFAASGTRTRLGVLDFNGSISTLRLASLAKFYGPVAEYGIDGNLSAHWALSGTPQDPQISADLKVPLLAAFGQKLSDVSVEARYRGQSLDIARASVSYGTARASLGGSVSLSDNKAETKYNIKGSFSGLDAELLKRNGLISSDIGISSELAGDFRLWEERGGPSARLFFRDAKLHYGNLLFSEINGSAALIDGVLTFERLRSRLNIGRLSLDGRISNLPRLGKDAPGGISLDRLPMEIRATASSADIGRISRLFMPDARGYEGYVNCSVDLTGTLARPEFSASGVLYGIRAFGLFLPFVRLESVSGSMDEIHMPGIMAAVGRGIISADADLAKSGDEWGGSLRASGRSVDIRSLMAPLDYERNVDVSGSLGFSFSGQGSASAFDGSGKLNIPSLSVMGAKFTEIEAPFWVSDGYIVIEDSSAKAYGGKVNAQIAKDIRMSDWGGTLDIKSADVAPALRDIAPDTEGVITGSADLKIHIAGDTKRTSTLNGNGSLEVKNGNVSGFSGAEAVSKLLGGKSLRFDDLNASFTVDGKTLYLLPGSRVSAPKGDPVFNYVMADGSITMEKDVKLFCVGNVNIRALNSFVGGVRGLVSSAIDEGTSGLTLQNFLGGAITGLAKDEFRDVSLTLKASSSDVSIEKVVIAEPVKNDLSPALNDAERRREKDDEQLRLNLEFPVGPGVDRRKEGIGSQVGGQVLEHALTDLLTF
ncbi:MAG: hypothetical protein LBF92_06140 [Synergistaceae bacterium]|jgi:hypothetical protein|nr:hypothetical protein [Synergistaceae bacterium]